MERLPDYISNHPFLAAAALALVVLVIVVEARIRLRGATGVVPVDAVQLLNQGALVIDVRDPERFAEGHIIGARNVPSANLAAQADALKKWKEKPVIICCDAGMTSATAARTLRASGFTKVVNLKGGLAAWQGENLPVVKATGEAKERKSA